MKREIMPEMVKFIDQRLKGNGLAEKALKDKDARTLFWLAATACVGITEESGKNDGKMVMLIQETVGAAGGEPWCMALVQTCLAYAEQKTGKVSPIPVSELCTYVWSTAPEIQRVKDIPLAGAIAIWKDTGKISGHTEIVLSSDGKIFHAVGGNTSGSTSPKAPVNRDGDACVYTIRSHTSSTKRKLLGFLKPF